MANTARRVATCFSSSRSPGPESQTVCSPMVSPTRRLCWTGSGPPASWTARASRFEVPLAASFYWLWWTSTISTSQSSGIAATAARIRSMSRGTPAEKLGTMATGARWA